MSGNPFLPGGGSGGSGGSNPFGGSSGGGRTTKPKPKPGSPKAVKVAQQQQNQALVRMASRLQNAQANQAAGARQAINNANAAFNGSDGSQDWGKDAYKQSQATVKAEVQKALKGYTPEQVKQMAQQGGLLPKQVDTLVHAVQANTNNPNELVPWAFDMIGRPAQAVKGFYVGDGGGRGSGDVFAPFRGAWKGLTGEKTYSGVEAAASVAGASRKDAKKFEASLPSPVRFAANLAIDTAVDPLTYVSLGTTSAEMAAARSAAADLAKSRAVEELAAGTITTARYREIAQAADIARATGMVTHDPAIQSAAQDLLTSGRKALTPELKQTLPKALQRKIRGAPGGIKIATKPIPGTTFLNSPEKIAAKLTKEDVKIALGRAKSGVEEATKPSAEIVRVTKAAYKEAKKNGFDSAHVDARVAKALDVGNTPQDWARLTDKERALATKLRDKLVQGEKEQQAVGLLDPEAAKAAAEATAQNARDKILNNPVIKRYSKRSEVLDKRATLAEQKAAEAEKAVQDFYANRTVGEFGSQFGARQVSDRVVGPARDQAAARLRSGDYGNGVTFDTWKLIPGGEVPKNHLVVSLWENSPELRGLDGLRVGKQILKDADNSGTTLFAEVAKDSMKADRILQHDRLLKFYERFGFRRVSYRDVIGENAANMDAEATLLRRDPVTPKVETKPGLLTSKDINAERALARMKQKLGQLQGKAAQLRRDAEVTQGRLARSQALAEKKAGQIEARKVVGSNEYLPRYLTEETRSMMPKVSDAPYSMGGPGLSSRLKARGEDWANRPAAERLNANGNPYYETSPSLDTIRRVGEGKRDVAHVESVNALRQIKTPEGAPMGLIKGDKGFEKALTSPEYESIDLPATVYNPQTGGMERAVNQQVLVRKEIYPDVHSTFDLLKDAAVHGDKWQKFLSGVNDVNRLWKGYATVFGPLGSGFVLRNMIGNVFNGFWLTGHMHTLVQDTTAALKIQAKIHSAIKAGEEWSARLTTKEADLIREADKFRAIESGFFSHGADLGNTETFTDALSHGLTRIKKSPFKRTIGAPFDPENPLLTKSGGVNSAVEDNARLALFLRLRKEGYTGAEATRVVHKYLFDYQTIDKGTQAAKRYLNPFFTWTRKNVPLQLEAIVKTPGKIAQQVHLLENLQQINPLDPQAVPGFAQDNAPIGIGGKPGNQLALLPDTPLLSALDATKPGLTLLQGLNQWRETGQIPPNLMQDFFGDLYKGVGPGGIAGVAATGVQVAAGKSAFSGAPLDSTTVKTPSYLGGGWIPGLPDRIPKSLQTVLEAAAPGLSKIRGVAPTDQKDQERLLTRLASILGGQTVVPANAKSKLSNTYARNEILDSLRKWLISQGVTLPPGQYQSSSTKGPFG